MPTNRDYTGLVRTPSSMAWLIRESATLKGRIAHLEKQQAELPARIEAYRQQLRALEAVIPLHEVQVDPAEIAPTRPQRKRIAPHGAMTRSIFECLRESRQQGPLCTTEIALFVSRACAIPWTSQAKCDLIRRVKYRLKNMAKVGDVIRHHDLTMGRNEEGLWSLRDD